MGCDHINPLLLFTHGNCRILFLLFGHNCQYICNYVYNILLVNERLVMKYLLFLFIVPCYLFGFQSSDEGRKIIALVSKEARGLTEGEIYTITNVQTDLIHAHHTGGGVGIHIDHQGLFWTFYEEPEPETELNIGVNDEVFEQVLYVIGSAKDEGGGDIKVLLKLNCYSSVKFHYWNDQINIDYYTGRQNQEGIGIAQNGVYRVDMHWIAIDIELGGVIAQTEPFQDEENEYVSYKLDKFKWWESEGHPENFKGYVTSRPVENVTSDIKINARFSYYDNYNRWRPIDLIIPVQITSQWSI